jgi:translation elongation factor EF-4
MLESTYVSAARCLLKYKLPLAHLVDDFFGKLKGRTRGYASLDYEDAGYETSDIVKMEVLSSVAWLIKLLVNGDPLDALASVMHRSLAERRGRAWVKKLKPMVDRQYFEVVIQAAIGKRVLARETVQPFRKDVTAKLYGGDHTRYNSLKV